jgi:phage protein D
MTTQAASPVTGTTYAVIKVGADGTPLPDDAGKRVIRTVAETHLHLPGTFEITFNDDNGNVVSLAGLSIGVTVQIFGPGAEDGMPRRLMTGEVTSIEGIFERLNFLTVVRGYDLAHRLQRTRRTRTFLNMKDSDIARQLAGEARLTVGRIDTSATTHAHLGQCDQTDWEFLSQRAREIGFETGVRDGQFYFSRAATVASGGEPVALRFAEPAGLYSFRPRLTSGNLAPQVEVRVWDPARAVVVAAQLPTATGSAGLVGQDPAAIAATFMPAAQEADAGADEAGDADTGFGGGGADLGPPPASDAYVVVDRLPATGVAAAAAADEIAAGLADHIGSTFAEAEGDAAGNAAIQAGVAIEVGGVPAPFAGTWLVTSARHMFDAGEGGYTTSFEVSGRQERSLLGLASAAARPAPARVPGLACGVVTSIYDPQGDDDAPDKLGNRGRVKVALPWLSPEYESDWAPVIQFGAGKRSGAMFLPEVGDQVLVGFELGDPRRPYVIGGIVGNSTGYDLGDQAVQATGMAAEVVRRGFVSAAGNRLVFHDELPPAGTEGPPVASAIALGTKDDGLHLAIDQTAGTVTLTCKPAPPDSQAPAGQLTIQCGDAGIVNITTGTGGSVTINGGDTLSLKAEASISIESSGPVAIKGSPIMLN